MVLYFQNSQVLLDNFCKFFMVIANKSFVIIAAFLVQY